MTQFPHDQFDDVQPYRQDEVGKHRAPGVVPASGAAGSSNMLKWIGLLVVAVLVVVAVGWFITRDGDEDDGPVAEEENGQEEEEQGEENGEDPEEGDEGEGNGDEEGAENGLSGEYPVRAVNAGAPEGSAGQLSSQMEELGLDVGQSINWAPEWGTPTTPQVIYPDGEQQQLAEAIAAEFEIETVNQVESWSTIVVVIGEEYE